MLSPHFIILHRWQYLAGRILHPKLVCFFGISLPQHLQVFIAGSSVICCQPFVKLLQHLVGDLDDQLVSPFMEVQLPLHPSYFCIFTEYDLLYQSGTSHEK